MPRYCRRGCTFPPFRLENRPGCVDQPDVAESLGEVAQQLPAGGVDFLGEQADVVDEGDGPFEDGAGPRWLTGKGQGLGQPEGAQQEGPFFAPRARRGSGSGKPVPAYR